jgi:hypothetical protein
MNERFLVKVEHQVTRPQQRATECIAVPSDVLGKRVNNKVRAQFDRPRHDRRRKRRVDGEPHATGATDRCDSLDVG